MHWRVDVRRFAIVVPLFVAACGDDGTASSDESIGGDDGSATTPTTGPSTTLATMTDASTDPTSGPSTVSTTVGTTAESSTTDDTSDTTSAVDDTTSGDTGGDPCAALGCAPNEYCDWPLNDCGTDSNEPPVCAATPDGCPPEAGDPVCGCDGVVYVNECGAGLAGVDVDAANDCAPPDGRFECGHLFCDVATSYCRVDVSDVGGFPDGYLCVSLPDACGETPSCDCLADEPCAQFSCEATPEGGSVIVCPGG